MPSRLASGDSLTASPMSDSTWGTNTSSWSALPVLEWCLPCVTRHAWYGTNRAECRTQPTTSLTHSLGENAWWPHSCASTHRPVSWQPMTYHQIGQNAYGATAGSCGAA